MADFCRQCSFDIFSLDYKDFAGLTTREEDKKELYQNVLCEGCGPLALIDSLGICHSSECFKQHNEEQ